MSAIQHRFTLEKGCVLVADCSYSMGTFTASGKRRIDHLASVLGYVLSRVKLQKLVCFNSIPFEIDIGPRIKLPEPDGGTALDLALVHVLEMEAVPERVIVLCDGQPNDAEGALEVAGELRQLGVPIDAYFCGDDGDPGVAFMAKLAAAGAPGGRSGRYKFGDDMALGEVLRLTAAGRR